jgi:hypothetical protein
MKFAGKEPIEVLDDIKFILELRLLNNIKGIYINPENCPALTAEPPLAIDEMDVDKKSQMYWLRFRDCRNQVVETEKKAWIDHFMVDKETFIGKCDFNFTYEFIEPPTLEFRNWLREELMVELVTSHPKVNSVRNEDDDSVK